MLLARLSYSALPPSPNRLRRVFAVGLPPPPTPTYTECRTRRHLHQPPRYQQTRPTAPPIDLASPRALPLPARAPHHDVTCPSLAPPGRRQGAEKLHRPCDPPGDPFVARARAATVPTSPSGRTPLFPLFPGRLVTPSASPVDRRVVPCATMQDARRRRAHVPSSSSGPRLTGLRQHPYRQCPAACGPLGCNWPCRCHPGNSSGSSCASASPPPVLCGGGGRQAAVLTTQSWEPTASSRAAS